MSRVLTVIAVGLAATLAFLLGVIAVLQFAPSSTAAEQIVSVVNNL